MLPAGIANIGNVERCKGKRGPSVVRGTEKGRDFRGSLDDLGQSAHPASTRSVVRKCELLLLSVT